MGLSLPASVMLHAFVGALLVLAAARVPARLSAPPGRAPVLIFHAPAAAAAPPLPRGGARVRTQRRARALAEVELVPIAMPIQPEERAPEPLSEVAEPAGSPTGSDHGDPEGIDGGQTGGQAGGSPTGIVGGCVGCEGEGPALDYDRPPRPLRLTRPVYPQEAFVKKIEGTVLLEILIDATGRVVDTRVLRSAYPDLDRAADEAVRRWEFAPALRRGRAVAVWARAPVEFRIY